jgi:hypothetical protein
LLHPIASSPSKCPDQIIKITYPTKNAFQKAAKTKKTEKQILQTMYPTSKISKQNPRGKLKKIIVDFMALQANFKLTPNKNKIVKEHHVN